MRFTGIIALVIALGACAAEAEVQRQIDECVANQELREGESLDSGFRNRAAIAHCRKQVTGEVN